MVPQRLVSQKRVFVFFPVESGDVRTAGAVEVVPFGVLPDVLPRPPVALRLVVAAQVEIESNV